MTTRRARRPLDPEAVQAANQAVAEEMDKRGEPRRKLTMKPDDYEYRKLWMDTYLDKKGKVEEPKPAAPPRRPNEPCHQAKRITIKLKSITFKSDHALLTDHMADWRKAGKRFEDKDKREWTKDHSFPISHTKQEKLKLVAEFSVEILGAAAVSGQVRGNGGSDSLKFDGQATFTPPKQFVSLEAKTELPNEVKKLDNKSIRWTVTCKGKTLEADTSKPHTIYLTMGTPVNQGKPEDGVTLRRMDKAVEWVGQAWRAGKHEPMDIVEYLFGKFKGYVLGFDHLHPDDQEYLKNHPSEMKTLEEAGFAAYMKKEKGGAWPLAEHSDWGGECQAIVRLIRGMLKQVGCPGDAEPKYVNADARKPLEARIRDYGTVCSGPDSTKGYALVDAEVKVGGLYGKDDGVGWNNYEAYLKFTHKKKVGWFGGGVGKLPEGKNQLYVFYGLAEFESEYIKATKSWKRKVTQLWKYPQS